MKRILSLGLATIALVGCNGVFQIENGRVPAEYLEQAKQVEGEYTGKIGRKTASMRIQFEGDKPVLTMTDPAGERCEAEIGNLETVYYQKRSNPVRITGVAFAFDANKCSHDVQGKQVVFWVGDKYFDMQIFAYRDWERKCDTVCNPGNPPYVPPSCNQQCHMEPRDVNVLGRFARDSKKP